MIIQDETFQSTSKKDDRVKVIVTSSSFFSPSCRFRCLLFTPTIRASQGLLLHRGNSQKSEHLKVIEDKVLDPSRMHDIQSVGHTWLLSDKTLSSSNSCSCIVASVGDKKTLPMPFKSFQSSPILGELLTGVRERNLLFVFRLGH